MKTGNITFIIPCSGSKINPTDYTCSGIEKLSYPELNKARNELIKIFKINLNWDLTLPAWKLYSGKHSIIHKKIQPPNWLNPKTKIKIVSALFGLINHTDYLPNYNLKMDNYLPNSKLKVFNFWRNKDLLQYLINKSDIDLLSKTYRKAFNKNGIPIALDPGILWRDKRGHHKGTWLNEKLSFFKL